MPTSLGKDDVCELPATAICWLTDEPQPGLVLVELVDAHGRPHQLVGKCAYFGGNLFPTSTYPCSTSIQCTIEDVDAGIATVSTWWVTSADDTPFFFDVQLDTLRSVTNA